MHHTIGFVSKCTYRRGFLCPSPPPIRSAIGFNRLATGFVRLSSHSRFIAFILSAVTSKENRLWSRIPFHLCIAACNRSSNKPRSPPLNPADTNGPFQRDGQDRQVCSVHSRPRTAFLHFSL